MSVGPIDNKIQLQGLENYSEADAQSKDFSGERKTTQFGLHQSFDQDFLDNPFVEMSPITVELESKTASFWSKIFSWWYQPEVKAQASPISSSDVDLLEVDEVEPISPVPVLDEPDCLPADLEAAKLPSSSKKTTRKEKQTYQEIMEALSLMSERTIEQIMYIILQAQIELEKENANVAEGTFSHYQDFQKFQEKTLDKIKDALEKDERVSRKLRFAQTLTFAASVICGIAFAAVSCGALAPAGAAIGAAVGSISAAAGVAAQTAFIGSVAFVAKFGPTTAAAAVGVTGGLTGWSQKRLNEDKAEHEKFKHQDQYYNQRLDDSREQLMGIAESDSVFKERLINLFRRFQKMCNLIAEK